MAEVNKPRKKWYSYHLGCPPFQFACQHQDLYIFSRASLYPKTSQPFEENYVKSPQNKHGTQKLLLCRCFSFSKEIFPGSMFVFGCGISYFQPTVRIAASISPMHILLPKSALQQALLPKGSLAGWRFQISFIFIPTWGNDPIWLIFFKWVETTN